MGSLHVIGDDYCKAAEPNWLVILSTIVFFNNHNCDFDPLIVANRCDGHCPQHRLELDRSFFDEFYALQAKRRGQDSNTRAVYQPVLAQSPTSPSRNLPTLDN